MKPILLKFPFYNFLAKSLIFAHYAVICVGVGTIGTGVYSLRYGVPSWLKHVEVAYLWNELEGTQAQIENEVKRHKAFESDVSDQLREMQEVQVKLIQRKK
tara:strand:- start:711 stop:1013 length:303 start_codon:yes stop_codon:yes gene_type:complete